MQSILNRYRNITILVLVLSGQLLLLAYQVKTREDLPVVRGWAVSAYVPLAQALEKIRANTLGLLDRYADLLHAQDRNAALETELSKLKLENQFLRNELSTAERGRVLTLFRERSPNRVIAARVVGTVSGGAKVVYVDRGTRDGVGKGMAVITPDGIAGKVSAAYRNGSQVTLITDSNFAAGVISQKHRTHGTLKGQGHATCLVDYIQNEENVEVGEWFFTSGDDRIFPKGLPVGQVRIARRGKTFFKEVFLVPSGLQGGIEELLIVIEGVHQVIPDVAGPGAPLHLLPPPPPESTAGSNPGSVIQGVLSTEADEVMARHKRTPPAAPAAPQPDRAGGQ
jgi:rod shape-determining protein MreC